MRFNVNKDIFEGQMLDVDKIATTKVVQNTTMAEDVEGEEFKEETFRASPSVGVDLMNEDDENVDNGVEK